MFKLDKFFIWNNIYFKLPTFSFIFFIRPISNFHVYNLIYERLEYFKTITIEPEIYYDVVKDILFSYQPTDSNVRFRHWVYIYLKFVTNSYQGYRHFFGLPVRGNRTWSNHKSQKKNNWFFEMYKQFFFKKKLKNCQNSRKKILLYIDVMNKLWYFQFRHEWEYAKKRRERYEESNKYVFWKFDLRALLANRVIILTEKKEKILKKNKKRKNKKKVRIKNNLFNIGFSFNFTKYLQQKIFRHFFVTKKSNIKKKKKKKNKNHQLDKI